MRPRKKKIKSIRLEQPYVCMQVTRGCLHSKMNTVGEDNQSKLNYQ